jgi:serine/threonine protein kinase
MSAVPLGRSSLTEDPCYACRSTAIGTFAPDPNAQGTPGAPTQEFEAGSATLSYQAQAAPAPAGAPWPQIGGYEILAEIGRGAMGVVYQAKHLQLKRVVAVKMVLAGAQASDKELARFRAEAEAVARLQHPYIVQIHEIGSREGRPFFALEFVAGGTLRQKLGGDPQPPRQAADLVAKLASAMQVAHERGIVHRDLKPGNVLLTPDGTPKIADFGLAKQLDADQAQTQTGAILGTPAYMAPEQASGRTRDIGPPADIYALGVILYEMLTGRPPFQGETALDTLEQARTQEPVPPRRLQAKVPRPGDDLSEMPGESAGAALRECP